EQSPGEEHEPEEQHADPHEVGQEDPPRLHGATIGKATRGLKGRSSPCRVSEVRPAPLSLVIYRGPRNPGPSDPYGRATTIIGEGDGDARARAPSIRLACARGRERPDGPGAARCGRNRGDPAEGD